MELIPLRFSMLNLYGQTHDDGSAETDSLIYEFNRTEFHIANTEAMLASDSANNI